MAMRYPIGDLRADCGIADAGAMYGRLCICLAAVGCGSGGGTHISGTDAASDSITISDSLFDAMPGDGTSVDMTPTDAPVDVPVDAPAVDAPAITPLGMQLMAPNAAAGDNFGWAIAISTDGSTLAVGAPAEDSAATGIGGNQGDNSATDSGAVYIFTRLGTIWMPTAYIKASNAQAFDEFGYSLALSADGSLLVVGALAEASGAVGVDGNQNDNSVFRAGAAYVFARSGTTWSQQAYLKASNTNRTDPFIGNERFGATVAVAADGATIAIAADYEDGASPGINGDQYNQGIRFAGAVYVFVRSGTTWAQQAYIKAPNPGMDDAFGRTLAISADGSVLAVRGTDSSPDRKSVV